MNNNLDEKIENLDDTEQLEDDEHLEEEQLEEIEKPQMMVNFSNDMEKNNAELEEKLAKFNSLQESEQNKVIEEPRLTSSETIGFSSSNDNLVTDQPQMISQPEMINQRVNNYNEVPQLVGSETLNEMPKLKKAPVLSEIVKTHKGQNQILLIAVIVLAVIVIILSALLIAGKGNKKDVDVSNKKEVSYKDTYSYEISNNMLTLFLINDGKLYYKKTSIDNSASLNFGYGSNDKITKELNVVSEVPNARRIKTVNKSVTGVTPYVLVIDEDGIVYSINLQRPNSFLSEFMADVLIVSKFAPLEGKKVDDILSYEACDITKGACSDKFEVLLMDGTKYKN